MENVRRPRRTRGLTEKQKRFITEYLTDLNASAAALRAGYKWGDIGRQLLTKNHVKSAIQQAIRTRAERTEITADLVVQETWKNYQRCVDADEFSAANKALELLGRGAFPNKHEHSGAPTFARSSASTEARSAGSPAQACSTSADWTVSRVSR